MSDQNLSSAAERVLLEVGQRVEQRPDVRFSFLLLAVLTEAEGRAAEILQGASTTSGTVPQPPASSADQLSFREWKTGLIRRADQFAIQASTEHLTGTEHLLLAAIDGDPPLAEFLETKGISLSGLLSVVETREPEIEQPAGVEIQIRSAEVGELEESALARILDAAANRCREGLRVIEDCVRFQLNDHFLSSELKEIRHQLTHVLTHLVQSQWVAYRDTPHDVGTQGSLASERFRGSLTDVVRANLKRVEESLRSLEEYSKLIDSELSQRISGCRYRFYTLEQAIETTLNSRRRLQNARLYLLVTDSQCRYGAETVIRNTITAGVDVVQLREKGMTDRQLIDWGHKVREWTQASGTLLIMNDRPDLAAAVGADGVHLGQDDMPVQMARKIVGSRCLIGVSTHHPEQARQAVFDGADYLGVGPVYPSKTKEFTEFAGLQYVRSLAGQVSLPWFAIGGIDLENLPELQRAGASRVAVSSVICGASHPRGIAQEMASLLARQNVEIQMDEEPETLSP
ncbi:thiamine phosphate synthase [Planctomicrobium sp. SH664]|uniref:thiamine phosphate synthase n=1 Tax=Planctomicrobium sp. SH664 TaxID=3448125 RepID=UPI003F5BEC6B